VEILGFGALFVTGIILGLTLPVSEKLAKESTNAAYVRGSNVLGYTYFLAWTVSFYPQVREWRWERRRGGRGKERHADDSCWRLVRECSPACLREIRVLIRG
jgi:hypothetical protein